MLVAERISDEVEQTLRYLRTRFGADVYGIEFSVHRAAGEIIISTTTIVGREQVLKPPQTWTPRERESDDFIRSKVSTDFLRDAVTSIEDWAADSGIEGLSVDHSTGSDHFIRYLGVTWFYYYYAINWLYMSLYAPTQGEIETLRTHITKKEEVKLASGDGKYWRCHVINEADLQVVKDIVLDRVKARQGGAP